MPVEAKRLNNDEPIILFTYNGAFTADMFPEVLALNAKYIEEVGGPIYVVADMLNMDPVGFRDMLSIIKQVGEDNPGAAHDENLKILIFVGSESIGRMYRDTLNNRKLPLPVALAKSLDDAYAIARAQIQMDKKKAQAND